MKRTKKAIASLAIAGMALTMIPFNAFAAAAAPTSARLGGYTAAQTAVKIADQTGWTGKAILASSASYGMVDSLTAGPLASFLKAPILLTEAGNTLNPNTKDELLKLNITTVYITSGTAVISQGVIDELKGMNITVESLGGLDRFATSVNIAQKMVTLGAKISKVAVAYGWLYQDALSISSIACAQTEPILLTEKDTIPESVQGFLTTNTSVKATDVIGGTGVISEAVKAQFPSATRQFGVTAYDTNLAVLKAFDSVLKYDHVFMANGETVVDALTGAPLAAKYNSGIVLTNGTANEGTAYVNSKLSATSIITALGGTAVVSDDLLSKTCLPPVKPPVEPPVKPPASSSASLNQVVKKLMSYRGYSTEAEIAALGDARANLLTAVTDGTLSAAAEDLITPEVLAKFEAAGVERADLKVKIIAALESFSEINYSSNKEDVRKALEEIKKDNLDIFNILFPGITVNQLYGFILATQDELQSVIKDELTTADGKIDINAVLALTDKTGPELKAELVEWAKTAITTVIQKKEFKVFDGKLADNGWTIDMLVDAQRDVGAVVDPTNAAEKAIAMSVIRSQIVTKLNGQTCTPDPLKPCTINKGDFVPVVSVKGVNAGTLILANMLVWTSSDTSVATVDDQSSKITGLKSGTSVITASKNGNELVRFTLEVK